MTFKERLDSIAAMRSELGREEAAVFEAREAALLALPRQYGYTSMAQLIAAVRSACGDGDGRGAQRVVTKRKKADPVKPVLAVVTVPVPVVDAANLSDPKNFALLPDESACEVRPGEHQGAYRQRLAEELRRVEKILHTSGVVARVWREWRKFEHKLREALSAQGAASGIL